MNEQGRLKGKQVLLGVSGSIAAYKAVDLLRRLQGEGAAVRVVMTENATRFVSRLTFATLSNAPVLVEEFQEERSGIGHIDITSGLDLAVVAPATANVIGKVASGIADDALTTALLAIDCPLVIAPAMNDRMYANPIVRRNIELLREQGVRFVEPGTGPLACGTIGQGRLAEVDEIVEAIVASLPGGNLAGMTVLVTAGPTREAIDAVRFISNPSTGRMGFALAAAARDRGADVILISGPTELERPHDVTVVPVVSAAEMYRQVMDRVAGAQIVIMAAAVSDFKPAISFDRKIKKHDAPTTLELERTEDILTAVRGVPGRRIVVGFAAETDNLLEHAKQKLIAKGLDMIVANDLLKQGAGFGCETNAVKIIDRAGRQIDLPVMAKTEVAGRIIDKIAELTAN